MKNINFLFIVLCLCTLTNKAMGASGGEYGTEANILIDPPTITTETMPTGQIGVAYTHTLTADGGTPIAWSLENGNLPTGLTLLESGIIYGYPTVEGTFNFTVKAQNSAGYDTKDLFIIIYPPVYIITDTLPIGIIGVDYEQIILIFGTPPIVCSLENGNLPQGLTLSTYGIISGIPTTEGTFNFTVKVQNSEGYDTKDLFIKIYPPVYIVTDTLPDGVIGVEYEQIIVASGTPPIVWSLENGNLPQGLTFDTLLGSISGIPTIEDTFNFTLKISNSEGFHTKPFSITVKSPQTITEKDAAKIMVYPNPTTNELRIENGELRINNVEIYDIFGKKQKAEGRKEKENSPPFMEGCQPQADGVVINISHLQSGIYFIKIDTELGTIVKKTIKQ